MLRANISGKPDNASPSLLKVTETCSASSTGAHTGRQRAVAPATSIPINPCRRCLQIADSTATKQVAVRMGRAWTLSRRGREANCARSHHKTLTEDLVDTSTRPTATDQKAPAASTHAGGCDTPTQEEEQSKSRMPIAGCDKRDVWLPPTETRGTQFGHADTMLSLAVSTVAT